MTPESPTRGRRQERTRRAILDAARELILERGLEGFSLREVARRADYTPGALYTYFSSAEELLGAVGMESLEVLGGYMGRVSGVLRAEERVLALAEAYLRFAEERPDEYAIVFERLTVPAESWAHFVRVAFPFTVLVEAFEAGAAEGAFEPRPGFGPAEMAYGLWCLAHGAAALSRKHLAALPDDMTAAQAGAVRAYVGGLGRRAGGGSHRGAGRSAGGGAR